jgi:hypothetical protein
MPIDLSFPSMWSWLADSQPRWFWAGSVQLLARLRTRTLHMEASQQAHVGATTSTNQE